MQLISHYPKSRKASQKSKTSNLCIIQEYRRWIGTTFGFSLYTMPFFKNKIINLLYRIWGQAIVATFVTTYIKMHTTWNTKGRKK